MDVLLSEYSQLDKKDIFDPRRAESLSHEQKKETLHLIIMLKEKGNSTIKARACVDGR